MISTCINIFTIIDQTKLTKNMKKLFFALAILVGFASTSFANEYKLNDQQVESLFENANDISFASEDLASGLALNSAAAGEQTVGGYLLRSFFCGFIGLHRSYMGTDGEKVWWWYFCIPVAGPVTNLVDFWGVVFMGKKQLDKYKNNGKKIVWLEGGI